MSKMRAKKPTKRNAVAHSLKVSLDSKGMAELAKAAAIRRMNVSDYVREVTLSQARKEIAAASSQTIVLSPEEQLAFWNALNQSPPLTVAQAKLGKLMRGER